MDIDTHDLVIEKLENVLKSFKGSTDEKWPISSRLADLLADRARLKFMSEQEQSCDDCLGSKVDREKALSIYQEIFPQANLAAQEKILLQMAHLHQAAGQTDQTRKLYLSIDQNSRYSPSLRGQALTGLGEISFRQGDFRKAKGYFEQAERIKETPQMYFVKYRKAWSQLNIGEQKEATASLITLLQNKSPEAPASFYEDASRDLATFMARQFIGSNDIEQLLKLSSAESRKANLYYLATEADRLGQKNASVLAFQIYAKDFKLDELEQMEVMIRTTQLQFDLGKYKDAVESFEQATKEWNKVNCRKNKDQCKDLSARFKNFVINWNKVFKTKPSSELSQAYQIYIKAFPEDSDMVYRSAQLAQSLKNYPLAASTYRQAGLLAEEQLKSKEERDTAMKIFEGSLLSEIEVAEASQNPQLQLSAYDNYINRNKNGPHVHKARYQKAQLRYKAADYKNASEQFREIALNKSAGSYQILAADLALDSLALLKDDRKIQSWSQEFSLAIPSRSGEFSKISRRAIVNESKTVLTENSKKSQSADVYLRMKRVSVKGATDKEKIVYYKNRLLLAEELKDLEDIAFCSQQLLKVKNLSSQDRNLSLAKLAWVQELKLDFSGAYKNLSQVKPLNKDRYTHQMKLAVLASLVKKPARKHFLAAVDSSRNNTLKNEALAKSILLLKNPWSEIKKHQNQLRKTPVLFSNLVIEAYGIRSDKKSAEQILKNASVRRTNSGQALSRVMWLENWKADFNKLISHKINSRSDKLLQSSIRTRLALLKHLEKQAQSSLKSSDWTKKLLLANLYSYENNRFYRELITLPTPKGLKSSERKQYRALLSQQAQPYKDISDATDKALLDLWKQHRNIDQLKKDFDQAGPNIQNLIRKELRLLSQIAPRSEQNILNQVLASKSKKPSPQSIQQAQEAVKSDPFNLSRLNQLKNLEAQRGQTSKVSYLEARLSVLKDSKENSL